MPWCEPLEIPEELLEPCDTLVEITEATPQAVFETVTENYKRLTECRIKYNALREAVQ